MEKSKYEDNQFLSYAQKLRGESKEDIIEEARYRRKKHESWRWWCILSIYLLLGCIVLCSMFYFQLDDTTDILGDNVCNNADLGKATGYFILSRDDVSYIRLDCERGQLMLKEGGY
jgi:hypothetical protein